jgi:hypothetical protein
MVLPSKAGAQHSLSPYFAWDGRRRCVTNTSSCGPFHGITAYSNWATEDRNRPVPDEPGAGPFSYARNYWYAATRDIHGPSLISLKRTFERRQIEGHDLLRLRHRQRARVLVTVVDKSLPCSLSMSVQQTFRILRAQFVRFLEQFPQAKEQNLYTR